MSRRTSAELRALILEAGKRVIYRRGLRATASHVPMKEALAELEFTTGMTVSMGSIFGKGRIWPTIKDFQLDLLESVVRDHGDYGPNDSSSALIHLLPDERNQSLERRIESLVEVCRIAGSLNGYVVEDQKGPSWALWLATWATAMSDSEAGAKLIPALRSCEQRTSKDFLVLYAAMLTKLGLRVRAPYTLDNLALLAAAMTDGLALRVEVVPERMAISSPPDQPPWSALGVGLKAIALELVEDDLGEAEAVD